MNYTGTTTEIISEQNINLFCKEELTNFNKLLLEDEDFDLQELTYENMEGNLAKAYRILCDALEVKTKIGIRVNYHDSFINGEPRTDEVDGVFWEVCNRTVRNPKISKDNHRLIKTVSYVEYS
jgi:hypothetical protein